MSLTEFEKLTQEHYAAVLALDTKKIDEAVDSLHIWVKKNPNYMENLKNYMGVNSWAAFWASKIIYLYNDSFEMVDNARETLERLENHYNNFLLSSQCFLTLQISEHEKDKIRKR